MSLFNGPDNRAFVDTATFGTTAIINGAIQVNGILDEDYIDPLGMSAASPAFTALVEDWTARPGDIVDIGARRWSVTTVEPDGQGFQLCRLKVVS